MKVLVVGSGGREHALAWKIAQSPTVVEVLVAPGNAGTEVEPGLRNVAVAGDDVEGLAALCAREDVELVVYGPEAPLVAGAADGLRDRGILVVGPGADGARLEGSKAFAKEIMDAAGVPTARFARVSTEAEVRAFVEAFDGEALVVKADGLAAGKGVVVCDDVASARDEAISMLRDQPFGAASATLILEERLIGVEASYMVLTDGTAWVALPTSQDHKRLGDGDAGPNTGGMGAYAPAAFVDAETIAAIDRDVIEPTLAELRRRGIAYRGFLYAGIMLTAAGPRVLEFNVRLGDPETQALMGAISGDILPALIACARGDVTGTSLVADRAAAVVVMAAQGYPSAPLKGAEIDGVDAANAVPGARVFHAGTVRVDGALRVTGGRVLGVTGFAETPQLALERAYEAVSRISWSGAQWRTDIGRAILS